MNRKVWYLSFLLHQKSCKNIKNLRKSICLKIGKKWEKNFLDQKNEIFSNFCFHPKNISIFSNFQVNRFSRVFNIFTWFFVQKKAEISYFTIQKFFTPSLVFYPTFVTSKVEHIWVVNMKSEQTSRLEKWGKKLVRGVKNFWFRKFTVSASFCTKNQQKTLELPEVDSHEYRAKVFF